MRARFLLGCAAALALTSGAAAAPPAVVGVAAAVINDVRIKASAARQFAKAAVRQRIALADQVQTGGASRMQLLLLDQSKFTVGANARLTIDRFVYDPSGGSMTASVAKGAFRFMSGRSTGRKNAAIQSPAATIGIRGTLVDGVVGEQAVAIARGEREIRGDVRHDPATATLVVLRGPGPQRQGNDNIGAVDVAAGGKTVTLDEPLLAVYVPYAGAQPIGPFSMSSPGVARINDLLLEPREVLSDPDAMPLPYPDTPSRRDRYDSPRHRGPGDFDGPYGPPSGYQPGVPGIGPGMYGAPTMGTPNYPPSQQKPPTMQEKQAPQNSPPMKQPVQDLPVQQQPPPPIQEPIQDMPVQQQQAPPPPPQLPKDPPPQQPNDYPQQDNYNQKP